MEKAQQQVNVTEPSNSRNYTTLLTKLTQSLYSAILAINLYASIAGVYIIAIAYAVYRVLGGAL